MNAILLTALAIGGVNGTAIKAIDMTPQSEVASGDCADCQAGGYGGHHARRGHAHALHGHCMGPMPQTCYDPAYGCYPGTRFMNRYPAFHGAYYRRPYNYRNVFDYPWHADLHEPTSFYSYQLSGDTGGGQPMRAEPIPLPPMPAPTSSSVLPLHQQMEQATASAPVVRVPKGLPTLRR